MSTTYLKGPVKIKSTGYNENTIWFRGEAYSGTPSLAYASEPAHTFYISRRKDAYPVELANSDSSFGSRRQGGATPISGFTDYAQEIVYTAKHLRRTNGIGTSDTLTDTAAFGTTDYSGRLLRDSSGYVFRIISNDTNTLTVSGIPTSGEYVILADFPTTNNSGFTGIISSKSGVGPYTIVSSDFDDYTNEDLQNRTIIINNKGYIILFFRESTNTIYVASNPGDVTGYTFTVIDEYPNYNSVTSDILGQFGFQDTDLEDNQYYYYTVFANDYPNFGPFNVEFDYANLSTTSQVSSLSIADNNFSDLITKYWPNVFKRLDQGGFTDLMNTFTFKFDELYGHVFNSRIKDDHKLKETALSSFLYQFNLPEIKNDVGYDVERRILTDLIEAYKLKGTKEGIAKFIRILTTWDITGGTLDYNSAIDDTLSYINWLRFWNLNDPNNTRLFGFYQILNNSPFVDYTYDNTTGIITFSSDVDLSNVTIATASYSGDVFIDGKEEEHYITAVDDTLNTLTISSGLIDITGETGTTTASSTGTITDIIKVWTVNQWIGSTLYINNYAHQILSNTADTLTFNGYMDHGIGITYYIDDDAEICTDDDAEIYYSSTATGSGFGTLTKAAAGWVVNQWQNFYVHVDGYSHIILSNTATKLTFDSTTDYGLVDFGIFDDGTEDSGSIYTIRADERVGRFPSPLPGAAISGHFSIREFTINIPNIALYVGESDTITKVGSDWRLTDASASLPTYKLINAYIIPKINNPKEIFKITTNGITSIDFTGDLTDTYDEGSYVVLSPLNALRFLLIIKMLEYYIPYFTRANYNFTITV